MAEAGLGKIQLFNDFGGIGDAIALTAASNNLGDFYVGGLNIVDADGGVGANASLLGGVVTLTSANVDLDTAFIGTSGLGFDVGLMGPIVCETRIQVPDLDNKQLFFGLTSVLSTSSTLEAVLSGNTTTITLTAASLCGFLLSSTLTDDEDWHGAYNGGTTTGETASASVDFDDDAVAGEWQVLRLEVDTNGDARWYIDSDLKQTVAGAVSTTANMGIAIMAGARAPATDMRLIPAR
ncbi:MAG: hypothetical protein IIC03_10045 [Proteobacteria bacterium]|nr:hypothetical protein [Pseudomonadota bacterium]